ncbi:hypothetical protein A2U01_0056357, partial [Trifolium medium]|nr:hypothetical protein [Trifolium medium]
AEAPRGQTGAAVAPTFA